MKINFIAFIIVESVLICKKASGLKYIPFDHKCRKTTDLNAIWIMNAKSLDKCILECGLRRHCASVIYKRAFPLCELYDVDVSTSAPIRMGGSCTVVRRNAVSLDGGEVRCKKIKQSAS